MSRGDRLYDISIRVLMLAVSAALIGCIALLAMRWNLPAERPAPVVPVTQVTPKSEPVEQAHLRTANNNQVLLAPGRVFRCESNGRVTFTDRPCPTETR